MRQMYGGTVYLTEQEVKSALKEAIALNKLRAERPNNQPIKADIYYTDVLVSIDALEIARRMEKPSPYKRWTNVGKREVMNITVPFVQHYEQCWMVGLVGVDITPYWLGEYMPKEQAEQKRDEYNKILRGEQ